MVEFPLGAVGVVGIRRLSWWDAADVNIKRVPLNQVGRCGLSTERLRYLFPRADEFTFRRCPRDLLEVDCINYLHFRQSEQGSFVVVTIPLPVIFGIVQDMFADFN
jgi:hypothetical protein